MCAAINGDLREKQGQIAHLDHDNENYELTNLVFLCLEHHDKYDSKTSQSKGYSIQEVLKYRNKLYKWADDQDYVTSPSQEIQYSYEIPWPFEIHYPKFKVLFRISPTIFDILPNHEPDVIDVFKAIEDPIHAVRNCFHVLLPANNRYRDEDDKHYFDRCALPNYCPVCKRKIFELKNGSTRFDPENDRCCFFSMATIKRGVFSDIRRLISLQKPLRGRISINKWNNPLSLVMFSLNIT